MSWKKIKRVNTYEPKFFYQSIDSSMDFIPMDSKSQWDHAIY